MRASSAAAPFEPAGEVATRAKPTRAKLSHELAGWQRLVEIRRAWKELAGAAAEPNVFYDPDYLIAAAPALGVADGLAALLVWRGAPAGEEDRLVGFLPFLERRRWLLPLRAAEALVQPYGPSSMPLIARDCPEMAAAEFVEWLAEEGTAPAGFLFRLLPAGPVSQALERALAVRQIPSHHLSAHQRPVLGPATGPQTPKRRRESERLWRRLRERGTVVLDRAGTPEALAGALEEYLDLESRGWKGRRGTAAASLERISDMFRSVSAGLGSTGQCRIDTLRLDGRAIAVAISLGQSPHWWLWKIAHDESLASLAPGIQLIAAMTDTAGMADTPEFWDSCATPGTTMMDRLWRQRRDYLDLLIVPGGAVRGEALKTAEMLRRKAEAGARRVVGIWRG